MRRVIYSLVLAAIIGIPNIGFAGPFEDGMKIVKDPAQFATKAGEAEKLFREATSKDGKNADAWYNLGVLQLRRGDKNAARDSFNKAVGANPKHLAAKAQVAGLELKNPGTEAGAVAKLTQIVETEDRFQAEARNLLAGYELKRKNWEAAIKHGRNALLGDKDNINAFLNIAIAYFNQRQYDQAGLVASSALESHPEAAALHNLMGLVYLSQDNSRQATEAFSSALKHDPQFDDARINLGALELAYGNFDSALKRFDEVLKKQPDNADLVLSRAVAMRGLQKYDEAEKGYTLAKQLAPGNAEIDYNLCILHQQYTDKTELAKQMCETYLGRIDNKNPKYREVQKRLKSIEAVLKVKQRTQTPPTPAPK